MKMEDLEKLIDGDDELSKLIDTPAFGDDGDDDDPLFADSSDDDDTDVDLDAAPGSSDSEQDDDPVAAELAAMRKEMAELRAEKTQLESSYNSLAQRAQTPPTPATPAPPKLTKEEFFEKLEADPFAAIAEAVKPVVTQSAAGVAQTMKRQRMAEEINEELAAIKYDFQEANEGALFDQIAGAAVQIVKQNPSLQAFGPRKALRQGFRTAREHYINSLRTAAKTGAIPGITITDEEDDIMKERANAARAAVGVTAGMRASGSRPPANRNAAKLRNLIKEYKDAQKRGDSLAVARMIGIPEIQQLRSAGKL